VKKTSSVHVALFGGLTLLAQVGCGGGAAPAGTGAAGTSGAAGNTAGAAGTNGGAAGNTAGAAGAAGDSGAAGNTAGAAGAAGAAGTSGAAGTNGGAAGTSGAAGATADGGAGSGAAFDGGVSDVAVPTAKFSFFATSLKSLQDLSKNSMGFGGDLRFGETGAGAGLRGADKICATIAERSMPGAGNKPWRAFLSAIAGADGKQVNAIDRIGNGPWYDRLGRTFALTKADLLADRPKTADPAIINDFPNETGTPNHAPSGSMQVDNHDFLTGSNTQGKLYGQTATCNSWTGGTGTEGKPRVGHTWPRGGGTRPAPDGGVGGGSGANWMSALDESGCAPGVNLVEMGGPLKNSNTVGSGGGYGGFYCFSLTP
jgi:hypothetical protein